MPRVPVEQAFRAAEQGCRRAIERALQRQGAQILNTKFVPPGNDDDAPIHEAGLARDLVDARGRVVEKAGEHRPRRVATKQDGFADGAKASDLRQREPRVERVAAGFQDGHVARDDQRAGVRLPAQRVDERLIVAPLGKTIQREAGISNLGGNLTKGRRARCHLFLAAFKRFADHSRSARPRQPSSMISSAKTCMRSGAPVPSRKLSQIQL